MPQHKKASVASARRAQETRLAQPLPEYQRKRRGHPPPGGAAPLLFKKIIIGKTRVSRVPSVARNARRALPPEAPSSSRVFLHQAAFLASLRSLATLDGLCRRKRRHPPASSCIKPRFSRPFGRSQRSTGFAAGSAAVLRLFLHQAAFLASRLLNHSRFPAFRKYRRSVRCRAQPLYLLTPSGRFALCATAHRADASLRRAHGFAVLANIGVLRAGRAQPLYLLTPAGRFALRATAHRADASLRRAHGFAALANIGVLRAGRAQPLYLLTPSGRFAQQPTGLTLPSGAPSPVPQHKKASVASARRAQETRLAQPLPEYQRKRRGHPPPGGAAPLLFKKIIIGKTRVSRVPSVARNARRALPPEALASSCVFLHQAAFLASLRSLATLDGLCRRKRRHPPASSCIKPRFSRPFGRSQRSTGFAAGSAGVLLRLPASSRVSCSLRSLATLTAFAAAEVFGALPQTPARA